MTFFTSLVTKPKLAAQRRRRAGSDDRGASVQNRCKSCNKRASANEGQNCNFHQNILSAKQHVMFSHGRAFRSAAILSKKEFGPRVYTTRRAPSFVGRSKRHDAVNEEYTI